MSPMRLNLQNLILPAGTAKLAKTEYQIRVNSSPIEMNDLNDLPIKTVNGATVYIKDVAQVRDGFQVQNNIVRTNGSRGVLITIPGTGRPRRSPSSTPSRPPFRASWPTFRRS